MKNKTKHNLTGGSTLHPDIEGVHDLDTYGGPAALPAVVAGKCDSADCVTPSDITAIKSCFTDPADASCTGKIIQGVP